MYNRSQHSDHLYTIRVTDNKKFIQYMRDHNVECGIHYECLHKNPIYAKPHQMTSLIYSERAAKQIVSIPFHEELSTSDVQEINKWIKLSNMLIQ